MREKQRKQGTRKSFLGVRAKLLLSFATVAVTTIAASAIGYYSINQIEKSIDRITNDSVPSMSQAMMLAQLSVALESSMPLLSRVESDSERELILKRLQDRVNQMYEIGSTLGEESGVQGMVEQVSTGVWKLDQITKERIASSEKLNTTMEAVSDVQEELDATISTVIDDENFNLTIATEDISDRSAYMLSYLITDSLGDLTKALNLKAQINSLLINYSIASTSSNKKKIEKLAKRTKKIVEKAQFNYDILLEDRIGENVFLTLTIQNALNIAVGKKSLFNVRIEEIARSSASPFKTISKSSKMLADSLARFGKLNTSMDKVINKIHAEIVEAAASIEKNTRETVPEMMASGIERLRQLLEVRANNNILYGILSETSQVDSVELIQPLNERYIAVANTINKTSETLDSIEDGGDELRSNLKQLLSYGSGETGIFELKKIELDALSNTGKELSGQNEILAEVLTAINAQVDNSKQSVADASVTSAATVEQGKFLLGAIVAASLLVTALIVWLQVSRNIVARLLAVVKALQLVSQGDLNCDIKVTGNDELSMLAKTVDIFREKALENERLQVAEKTAAEEREVQRRTNEQREKEIQETREQKIKEEQAQAERERELAEALERDTDSLLSVVRAASTGDLTKDVTVHGEHPAGQLGDGLETLIDSFSNVMDQISQSADSVSQGSQEIAQGNTQLAERTQLQAENLKETSESMEQMTESVMQNTENAQKANQLADRAQQTAEQGSVVVTEAVKAMEVINSSSLKIKDIVGVIDEIAFQTNLLALNAAVEAARAGEQGRGFAVVATEVRNLAARSATAAKEIKELIEDSVVKVDHGVKLVGESGETLNELLGAVRNVTNIVGDIVVASENQTQKISQVNDAVSTMESMTQQNATLVKEVASASDSMAGQSVNLGEHVSFFNFKTTSSHGSNADTTEASEPSKQWDDEYASWEVAVTDTDDEWKKDDWYDEPQTLSA